MLHLVNRLLADVRADPVIPPVVAHLGMDEVLVDRRELLTQCLVQLSYHFVATAHSASLRKPSRPRPLRRVGAATAGLVARDAIVCARAAATQAARTTGAHIASET